MFVIKLQKKSNGIDKFDKVIEFEDEDKARFKYIQFMRQSYYFGRLVRIVNGREENMASFCNSEFA